MKYLLWNILTSALYVFSLSASEWDGWTSAGSASEAPAVNGRGTCLMISRNSEADDKVNTFWQSPVLRSKGKNTAVFFRASENYSVCKDPTYSAEVQLFLCDAHGGNLKPAGTVAVEWDPFERGGYFGPHFKDTMAWKAYTLPVPDSAQNFIVRFTFPKPLLRGECRITDFGVCQIVPKAAEVKQEKAVVQTKKESTGYGMWLCSPATAQMFYTDEELRFDAAYYSETGKLALPAGTKLFYTVKDYVGNKIGSGSLDLADAKTIDDPEFYRTRGAQTRKLTQEKLAVKRFILPKEMFGNPGQILFLFAELRAADGKVLASDAIPYCSVKPSEVKKEDKKNSLFFLWWHHANAYTDSASKHQGEGQNIATKLGGQRECFVQYSWKEFQPKVPGPVSQEKDPRCNVEHPVMFMPNCVQWPYSNFVPEGAITKHTGEKSHNGERIEFNLDLYHDYLMEYLKVNHENIDVILPGGAERSLTQEVCDFQKKIYTSIKAKYPEMKVAFMLYGEQDFELFKKNKLYDYCDVFDSHFYDTSLDFTWKHTLDAYYRNVLKRKPVSWISTEASPVSGTEQIPQNVNMCVNIWNALSEGFIGFNYFMFTGGSGGFFHDPILTGPTRDTFMHFTYAPRPLVAPEAVNLKTGKRHYEYSPMFPLMKLMTYYTIIREFDYSVFRKIEDSSGNVKVYIFDRADGTKCGIRLAAQQPTEIICVKTDIPFICRDLFGRITRILPQNGKAYITIGNEPLMLFFEGKADKLAFESVPDALLDSSATECSRTLPEGEITSGTWMIDGVPGMKGDCRIKDGKASFTFDSTKLRPGDYPVQFKLNGKNGVYALLSSKLTVRDAVSFNIMPLPPAGDKAGIRITVSNRSGKDVKGTVSCDLTLLGTKNEPEIQTLEFNAPAKGTAEVVFPVSAVHANPLFNEELTFTLNAGDVKLVQTARITFRFSKYAEKAPVIDGDPSDWDLKSMQPVKSNRFINTKDGAKMDSPAKLYSMWDKDNVYFLLLVRDSTPVSRSMDVDVWMDDNIMMSIYPWRILPGESLKTGAYREHIGLLKDGTAGKFRLGAVTGGVNNMDGVKVAIKRTPDGYVYELVYSKDSLFPLEIKEGGGLRVSILAFDAYIENGKDVLTHSYIGGFSTNINSRPEKWCEFIFVKDAEGKNE